MRICSNNNFILWNKMRKRILRKWSKIGCSPEYTMNAISYVTGNISTDLIFACARNCSLADHTDLHHPVTGSIWFPVETGRGALHTVIMEVDALGILQKNQDGFYNPQEMFRSFLSSFSNMRVRKEKGYFWSP